MSSPCGSSTGSVSFEGGGTILVLRTRGFSSSVAVSAASGGSAAGPAFSGGTGDSGEEESDATDESKRFLGPTRERGGQTREEEIETVDLIRDRDPRRMAEDGMRRKLALLTRRVGPKIVSRGISRRILYEH